MKEDFSYCDQVTTEEETLPASINRLSSWNMEIHCVENAMIFPWCKDTEMYAGEVILQNGEVVPDASSSSIYPKERRISEVSKNVVEGDEIIYIGAVNPCWGHYITDGICKLWCLESPLFKELIARGVPVCFVSAYMPVDKISMSWRHLVDLLGGENVNILPIQTATRYKRVWIPTSSIRIKNSEEGRFYTKEYRDIVIKLRERALEKANNKYSIYDKIYLSRTKLDNGGHTEFGERQIERAFRQAGFHIIYPEKLSFEQQVCLLYNAKSVAATMGSISHNFMFCKHGTDAIILRKAWYSNNFQYIANQLANISATYIDCHLSVFVTNASHLGPFYMYINENVQRFFRDRYALCLKDGFNRRLFTEYAMLCMQRGDFCQRYETSTYYFDKMADILKIHQGGAKKLYRLVLSLFAGKTKRYIRQISSYFMR